MNTNQPAAPEPALDPRAALASLNQAAAATRASIEPNTAVIYFVWAAAYLAGYGLLHGAAFGWLPLAYGTALLIGAGILLAAVAYTAVAGIRSGSRIRGDSKFAGMAYGMSWMGGFLVVALFSIAISRLLAGTDQLVTGWLINSVAILVVGIMYMAGAAVFQDRPMFLLGACFTVLNAAGLIAGAQAFISIFAIGGPVLFVAAGIAMLVLRRRETAGAVK
ncbi:hypothetical protein GCM10009715_31990 [Paeniglutamicibacter psychrophenolicus]|uniref:Transporter n=1 Tax=Paeniglutamicibacter psychrophenolicus TaxID=257454 RepID=A0ABS4W9A1_9MICC|nr:hypothetical protein [Paeniglutamicibacter psychrophenolicus]MBP2372787.1 hypothetical protein [Paeniglutamicibacter psychrophenolicus]